MNMSVSVRVRRAFAICCIASALSMHAHAATAQQVAVPTKPLAPACKERGTMVDVTFNEKIAHRYMLLMVFAKGTGGQYFGGATFNESGCLADVPTTSNTAVKTLAVAPARNQLYVLECPNDCEEPHGTGGSKARAMIRQTNNGGSDPLGSNPWGILSAADPLKADGVPDGKVEIWQVTVRDACQAYALYKFHSGPDQVLGRAMAKGDFLGQILVGYPNATSGGASQSCQ